MIKENFVEEPASLAAKRVAFFKKYLRRAKELRGEEEKLRASMPPHVLALVGNKRLALWKEVLNDLDYPDKSLIDDIASGFKLNGWMPRSMFSASRQEASHVNGDLKDPLQSLECHHLQEHECQARA